MKAGIVFLFLVAAATSSQDEPPVFISENDRIIGGMQTIPHAYPFMARLHTVWPGRIGGSCGGSLINPEWVLTAAHCVYILDKQLKWESVTVTLGDHYVPFLDTDEVSILAEDVIIHSNYINYGKDDLALIKLRTPAQINRNVKPGCINGGDNDFIGQQAIAIGWGLTSTIDNYQSTVLKEATLPVVSPDHCPSSAFDQTTMVCTGFIREVGQDTVFKGDSGGPLFFKDDGFDIFGVASFVTLDDGWPQRVTSAVFTKTSAYMDWIKENTGATDLCIK